MFSSSYELEKSILLHMLVKTKGKITFLVCLNIAILSIGKSHGAFVVLTDLDENDINPNSSKIARVMFLQTHGGIYGIMNSYHNFTVNDTIGIFLQNYSSLGILKEFSYAERRNDRFFNHGGMQVTII